MRSDERAPTIPLTAATVSYLSCGLVRGSVTKISGAIVVIGVNLFSHDLAGGSPSIKMFT